MILHCLKQVGTSEWRMEWLKMSVNPKMIAILTCNSESEAVGVDKVIPLIWLRYVYSALSLSGRDELLPAILSDFVAHFSTQTLPQSTFILGL